MLIGEGFKPVGGALDQGGRTTVGAELDRGGTKRTGGGDVREREGPTR